MVQAFENDPHLATDALVLGRSFKNIKPAQNKVWEKDYASNPDAAPEKRLEYMLGYQMSRMCRDKGAVKHDDRVDALSQGVQYFIDSLAQSAHRAQALRKNEEWKYMVQAFENDPHLATDALVLGRSFKNIRPAQNQVWDWS